MNPKAGIQIIQTEKQIRNDSKKLIQEFNVESKNLEQIVHSLFPKIEFSIKDTDKKIKLLKNHIDSFDQKLQDKEFPSKDKPYPIDYSIPINSGLLLYIICRTIKPEKIFETGVAYGYSSCFILEALYENNKGKLFSIDSIFRPWETKEKIGSMIPKKLRVNWEINFGESKSNLEKLLGNQDFIEGFVDGLDGVVIGDGGRAA